MCACNSRYARMHEDAPATVCVEALPHTNASDSQDNKRPETGGTSRTPRGLYSTATADAPIGGRTCCARSAIRFGSPITCALVR